MNADLKFDENNMNIQPWSLKHKASPRLERLRLAMWPPELGYSYNDWRGKDPEQAVA